MMRDAQLLGCDVSVPPRSQLLNVKGVKRGLGDDATVRLPRRFNFDDRKPVRIRKARLPDAQVRTSRHAHSQFYPTSPPPHHDRTGAGFKTTP
jgi:hypothetical protein